MCSRYQINSNARDIMAAFELPSPPTLPNTPEIRPTDLGLIIDQSKNAGLKSWGFSVAWTKQPMINARAETLTGKPTFRARLGQRCVVPFSDYFEWRTDDRGNKRINTIRPTTSVPIAFAGLHDEGTYTIITCEPAPAVAHIHNRMPVLLDPTSMRSWLSDDGFEKVSQVLTPYKGGLSFDEEVPPPPAQGDLFD